MTKLVLIDHSLKRVGGHNHDYAVNVLQAAQQAGQEVVLATHRLFRRQAQQVGDYQVFSIFQYDTFSKYSLFTGGKLWNPDPIAQRATAQYSPVGWVTRIGNAWWRYRGQQVINSFAASCQRLFREVPVEPGDFVFLPTISEFDLLGLVQYLKTDPRSRWVQWILQFHFDIFAGRQPDYDSQTSRIEALRRHFGKALGEVPEHRFVFLNPTQNMADQYNHLNIVRFQELPYPVNETFQPRKRHHGQNKPLRITCAGHFRREKGRCALAVTIDTIWDCLLAKKQAQLVLQGSPMRIFRMIPRRYWPHVKFERDGRQDNSPIAVTHHPLDRDDYTNFIGNTDIGLFLYDSQRYYARCSGILVEMLSSGIPVIVPAGSWLAEQISEPNYQYLENLVRTRKTVSVITYEDTIVLDNQRNHNTLHSKEKNSLSCPTVVELTVPRNATELLVSFRWKYPLQSGTYLCLKTESIHKNQKKITPRTNVVGHREVGDCVPVLIPLKTDTTKIRLHWSNAYHNGAVHFTDVQFRFLVATSDSSEPCPTGAVGLVAGDTDQVPRLLHEMVRHYHHYREMALEFSATWRQQHRPADVVNRLIAVASDSDIIPFESPRLPMK